MQCDLLLVGSCQFMLKTQESRSGFEAVLVTAPSSLSEKDLQSHGLPRELLTSHAIFVKIIMFSALGKGWRTMDAAVIILVLNCDVSVH